MQIIEIVVHFHRLTMNNNMVNHGYFPAGTAVPPMIRGDGSSFSAEDRMTNFASNARDSVLIFILEILSLGKICRCTSCIDAM